MATLALSVVLLDRNRSIINILGAFARIAAQAKWLNIGYVIRAAASNSNYMIKRHFSSLATAKASVIIFLAERLPFLTSKTPFGIVLVSPTTGFLPLHSRPPLFRILGHPPLHSLSVRLRVGRVFCRRSCQDAGAIANMIILFLRANVLSILLAAPLADFFGAFRISTRLSAAAFTFRSKFDRVFPAFFSILTATKMALIGVAVGKVRISNHFGKRLHDAALTTSFLGHGRRNACSFGSASLPRCFLAVLAPKMVAVWPIASFVKIRDELCFSASSACFASSWGRCHSINFNTREGVLPLWQR